ncbi:hypothetical protein [Micromonospora sp. 4G55]|uniref:hypothetical protein n=1 Tax=Micromonospora sp. 4G55 TaxID=2806102 RepID=UPI001A5D08EF|nr:hypothetical protein [Micromonospora sp. 4G55]MBM0260109.1 hypothetical protein [Micromonospora sp. 4G55]
MAGAARGRQHARHRRRRRRPGPARIGPAGATPPLAGRLTLPVLVEVIATSREGAFDTAEAAVETALTGAELDVRFEWDGSERDDADPGDLDTTAAEPAELR